MRKLTVQLKDINGNVTEEKEIHVEANEILIMKYPETITLQQAHHCYRGLTEALETGKSLIGLPESISFEVIKVVENNS